MTSVSAAPAAARATGASRWSQLFFGVICMVMIANLQYGWNLFVDPIDAKHHWGRAEIQVAFTLFVLTETWLIPVEGWFVDRYGPRLVVAFGGIMVAIAWTINSFAGSLTVLYAAAIISGIGAGAVYGTCVGNAAPSISPGARSTACFRRCAPMPSAPRMPPPMPARSTPPRAPLRFWFRWRAS